MHYAASGKFHHTSLWGWMWKGQRGAHYYYRICFHLEDPQKVCRCPGRSGLVLQDAHGALALGCGISRRPPRKSQISFGHGAAFRGSFTFHIHIENHTYWRIIHIVSVASALIIVRTINLEKFFFFFLPSPTVLLLCQDFIQVVAVMSPQAPLGCDICC